MDILLPFSIRIFEYPIHISSYSGNSEVHTCSLSLYPVISISLRLQESWLKTSYLGSPQASSFSPPKRI